MMVSVTGAASRRVLVVEDEYLIAKRFAGELAKLGIETVGPAGTVAQALALIAHGDHLDGATLDIKVRDDKVFAVADALQARGCLLVSRPGTTRRQSLTVTDMSCAARSHSIQPRSCARCFLSRAKT
jgi:CheY-like chemotaxis protein